MRDDYLSADWAHSHGQVTRSLNALIETISVALARLHHVQFDAPWKHESARH